MTPLLPSVIKKYRYLAWLIPAVICCLFVSCDSDDMEQPPKIVIPHGQASFVVAAAEQNIHTIGVKVLDKDSVPRSGVKVYFKVKRGNATFADSVATTDADGIASVMVTPGTQSGSIVITAQAEPLIEFPVFFTFLVTSSIPAKVEVLSGNNQEALENTRLSKPLMAIVKDKFGNPVPTGEVTFSITSGNGTLSRNVATLINGIASVEFTTGKGQPASTVKASIGNGAETEFSILTLLPVQLTTITYHQGNMQLSWTKSQSPNFKSYSVYRRRAGFSDNTKLAEITDPAATTFEDPQTNLGMVYSYYIRVDTKLGDYIDSELKNGEAGNGIKLPNAEDTDIALDTQNGLIYLSVYNPAKILIVSATTFQKVDSIMLDNFPRRITLSADFSRLYVAYSGSRSFDIFQVATKSVIQTVDVSTYLGSSFSDLHVTSNNDLFAVGAWVVKIDEANGYAQQKVGNTTMSMLGAPRFVGDRGNYLYIEEGHYTPNSLYKLDLSQPAIPQVLEDAHGSVYGTKNCALSPDGEKIYLVGGMIINTSDFGSGATLPDKIYALALSENGHKVYSCAHKTFATGSLKTFDASTLAVEKELVVGFLASRMFTYNNALYVLTELQWPSGRWRLYKLDISE